MRRSQDFDRTRISAYGMTLAGAGSLVRRQLERGLRWLLHVYWRCSRGLTLGVRAVVIDADQRVFLVRHTYVRGWHLPGGGVEPGETLVAALTRELREEGNIEVIEPPLLHGIFYNRRVSRRDHVALFVVRSFRQPQPPVPNHEIAAHGFFAMDGLPDGATAGTRARLTEVLLGTPLDQLW